MWCVLSTHVFSQNTFPTSGNVGIGTTGPVKALEILSSNSTNFDPTLRLSDVEAGYGHLTLITTPNNFLSYARCRDNSVVYGVNHVDLHDMILVASKAKDLILTTKDAEGHIRFSTTPVTDLNAQGDYERLTITPTGTMGVGTSKPLGFVDINFQTGFNAKFPRLLFDNTIRYVKTAPGQPTTIETMLTSPAIKFYNHTGEEFDCEEGSGPCNLSSYNWTIASNYTPEAPFVTNNRGYTSLEFMVGMKPPTQNAQNPNEYISWMNTETPVPRMSIISNGNVGINERLPVARLQMQDGSVLFNGSIGSTPKKSDGSELGAGTRLMWIPSKAAFRAGVVDELFDPAAWNADNIGYGSGAIGANSRVQKNYSFAAGYGNYIPVITDGAILPDEGSIALGVTNTVNSESSYAMGQANTIGVGAYYSLALGYTNIINNASFGGTAIGWNNMVYADESYTFGKENITRGHGAVAIGCNSEGNNMASIGIGHLAVSNHINSVAIGAGLDNGPTYMKTTTDNCLIVGFNSDVPTFFVGGGNGNTNSLGMVGIGTTEPKNRLDVNGSASVGYGTTPTSLGSGNSLAVNGRVGIGTVSPECNLGVNGTACFGWGGEAQVPTLSPPTNPVGIVSENTVIIGGSNNQPAYVTAGNRSIQESKLQVWGDAIKFQSNPDWDVPSDARYKKDIKPYTYGLRELKKIEPVRFYYDNSLGIKQDKEGVGVLAQDIQKIFPNTVTERTLYISKVLKEERRYQVDATDTTVFKVPDYSAPFDEHGNHKYKDSIITSPTKRWVIEPREFGIDSMPLLTYNPSELNYAIINSVKELDTIVGSNIEELRNQIATQSTTIDSLTIIIRNLSDRIARIETQNQINLNEVSDVILEQNNPNPFADQTTITYYIPESVSGNPELIISPTTHNEVLKTVSLSKGTPTQLTVSAEGLQTGVYVYSIIVANKVLASKKFIIIK